MNDFYNVIVAQLETKKAQLEQQRGYFQVMTENEINTGCFEQNAISALLSMLEAKTEIKTLEHMKMLIKMQRGDKE